MARVDLQEQPFRLASLMSAEAVEDLACGTAFST